MERIDSDERALLVDEGEVAEGCEEVLFFFFQAEDGIRGARESRGLGVVYKRQPSGPCHGISWLLGCGSAGGVGVACGRPSALLPPMGAKKKRAVPYTHLTLPTKRMV